MELDEDLRVHKDRLERSIKKYKCWAIVFAGAAFIPFFVAGYYNITNPRYLFIEETGSYIGGCSAPFASLAGIFFVYVAFLGQRLQIMYQQQELRTNQKELQETRKELKGQKEQLELQNQQFENQAFERTFFRLLDYCIKERDSLTISGERYFEMRGKILFKHIYKYYHDEDVYTYENFGNQKETSTVPLLTYFPDMYRDFELFCQITSVLSKC